MTYHKTTSTHGPAPRQCPDCGAPMQGYRLEATGAWVWGVCACHDTDALLAREGLLKRTDNGLQDALGEQDHRD
jgi:hypothetical protein